MRTAKYKRPRTRPCPVLPDSRTRFPSHSVSRHHRTLLPDTLAIQSTSHSRWYQSDASRSDSRTTRALRSGTGVPSGLQPVNGDHESYIIKEVAEYITWEYTRSCNRITYHRQALRETARTSNRIMVECRGYFEAWNSAGKIAIRSI